MAITATNIVDFSDTFCGYWNDAVGTDASTFGIGVTGASARAYNDAQTYITQVTAAGLSVSQYLGSSALALGTSTTIQDYVKTKLAPSLAAWKLAINALGITNVTNLDAFAAYYNKGSGGPYNCLFNPIFREIFYSVYGAYPQACNTFYEIKQGSRFTNAMRKMTSSSTQTAGTDIDSTKYAGGIAAIKYVSGSSGHAGPSPNFELVGTWRKSDGSLATGTANFDMSDLSGTPFVVTPPFTGALLVSATTLRSPDGLSSVGTGTLYAQGQRPAGRPTYAWEANI